MFQIEKNVSIIGKNDYGTYPYVGYSVNSSMKRFKVFSRGFSNPVSASIFAYLSQIPQVPWAVAEKCVVGFEKKLNPCGAIKAMYEVTPLDLVTKLPEIGPIIEVASKCVMSLGGAIVDLQVSSKSSNYNPHMPTNARNWASDGTTQYVDYAVKYWKKHPKEGPAYKLLSDA
ncbi:hypothetical protein Q31b_37900 [Novipirellula aureliae]|uniref:Uncharacterized protein n=1 Tax=Novipirellula aureliae TaxID=2527966 RepID=A0A5C6DQ18_9BACT|nr:hypothetical protein [Novipirellula aureliae]TWU38712.1 hypothetical protein Q31b_37900 [Novipirellula aureliae]